jgi:hypothetical protein
VPAAGLHAKLRRKHVQELSCQGAQAPNDLKMLLLLSKGAYDFQPGYQPVMLGGFGKGPNSSAATAVPGLSDQAAILGPPQCCPARQAVAVAALCTSQPMLAVAYRQPTSQNVHDAAIGISKHAGNDTWENRIARMGLVAIWDTSNPSKLADVFCTAGSDVSCLASGPPCAQFLLIGGGRDGCILCWDLSSGLHSQATLCGRTCTLFAPSACATSACATTSSCDEINDALNKNTAEPILCIKTQSSEPRHDTKSAFHVISLCESGAVDMWSVLSTSAEAFLHASGSVDVDIGTGVSTSPYSTTRVYSMFIGSSADMVGCIQHNRSDVLLRRNYCGDT